MSGQCIFFSSIPSLPFPLKKAVFLVSSCITFDARPTNPAQKVLFWGCLPRYGLLFEMWHRGIFLVVLLPRGRAWVPAAHPEAAAFKNQRVLQGCLLQSGGSPGLYQWFLFLIRLFSILKARDFFMAQGGKPDGWLALRRGGCCCPGAPGSRCLSGCEADSSQPSGRPAGRAGAASLARADAHPCASAAAAAGKGELRPAGSVPRPCRLLPWPSCVTGWSRADWGRQPRGRRAAQAGHTHTAPSPGACGKQDLSRLEVYFVPSVWALSRTIV